MLTNQNRQPRLYVGELLTRFVTLSAHLIEFRLQPLRQVTQLGVFFTKAFYLR
jgi:hypothetical protein